MVNSSRCTRLVSLAALTAALALTTAAQAALVGYWPLDGDGTAVVGTDGAMVNGPTVTTDRNGAAGGGLAFNGADQEYVSIAGGGGLDGTANATVSLWVQWNGTQDAGWGNRNGAVMGRQKNGQWSDDVLCIYSTTDPNASNINWEARVNEGINSGVQPGSGTWHHIAATMRPDDQVLYVDGVARSMRNVFSGHRSDPSIPLTIGAWTGDGASYSTSSIDDVAVWNHAFSPIQVAALAAQTHTPLTVPDPLAVAGATASSEIGGSYRRYAANTADGVGHTTTTPDGNPGEARGMWLSASGDTTGQITYDLGSVQQLGSMVLYNYNEYVSGRPDLLRRGVQDARVLVSTDGTAWESLGIQSFMQAPGNVSVAGQEVRLGGVQARYVQLDILANHGDSGYAGLNEVEFFAQSFSAPPAVPKIEVVSARASSELLSNFRRYAANTVDGIGKYTTMPDGYPSDSQGMWLTHGTYRSPNDTDPEIAFDLGGIHQLDSLTLYNYNEAASGLMTRGVNQAEVLVSTDNVTYTSLGTQTFAMAPGDGTNPGQQVALGGVAARYVKLDILSNHGDSSQFAGLSEVEFSGTPLQRMPLGGVSVAPSSEMLEASFDRRAVHVIDGTGQFAGAHNVVPETTMWLTGGIAFGSAGNDDGNPELVFDLGQTYTSLESARIWNYNEYHATRGLNRRGIQDMEVLVSSDGVTYRSLGVHSLPLGPATDGPDFSQVLDLNASDVRYVKLDVLSNHYGVTYPTADGSTDNALVGLSEVRFYGGQAPAIVGIGARATSELKFRRYAANTVDGVGSATTSPDGWPGEASGAWLSHGTYHSPHDTAPEIAFDLGGVHQLDSFVLYNYNEVGAFTTRGVNQAEILVSSDNVTWTSLGTRIFDMAPGTGANPGQLVALGNVAARYVKLDILSNHGDSSQFAGLNEVKFFGTPLEQLPIRVGGVAASTELMGSFHRPARHLVDSTGYYADTHSVVPDGHMWLSANGDEDPWVLFDLGDRYRLETIKIWNYNEAGALTTRGVSEFELFVSSDGLDFRSLGIFDLDIAPGLDDVDFSELLPLNAFDVQYVIFDILDNHGDASYVGLSEVHFHGVVIPEPATIALLALGALAALRRRRT